MRRRSVLAGLAGALAVPAVARAQGTGVLRMVPQANLTSLDPIFTTANITRNHAFMVYDTLYGMNTGLEPQPQMAAGHQVEQDGRRVTITLRDGLLFHDGAPVLSRDVVASVKRWMARNPYGQKLAGAVDELGPAGDTAVVFRLKTPFPLLFHALATIGSAAFIMPERVASTDPFKQIDEVIGSGPFRFKRDEWNSGSLVVYERNPAYRPREEAPSLTAGGKRVFFDRVEWQIITDAATATAALQRNEIQWYEQPPPELQALLKRGREVNVEPIDRLPNPALLRLNHLHPPFDDVAVRRAILPAIDQADFMIAIVGDDPSQYVTGTGVYTPGTPNATKAGLEPLLGPRSIDKARAELKAAGYTDGLMRLIGPTDILAPAALTQVAADMFRRIGINQDVVLTDWGTVVQRRASREPLDKGGWSAFLTATGSFDCVDPGGHSQLRANGLQGWFGWPTVPKIEELRDAWFDAPDEASRKRLTDELQRVAIDQVVYVPVGAYWSQTALRRNLVDRVIGFALFWGLRPA